MIKVNPEKITVDEEIIYPFFSADDKGHTAESYEYKKSIKYPFEDIVISREMFAYLPKFGDEIKFDGAEKIKAYYAEKAKDAESEIELFEQESMFEDEIINSAAINHLNAEDYSVSYVGKYMSVTRVFFSDTGGAHPISMSIFENFDMETGEILSLDQVLDMNEATVSKIEKLILASVEASGKVLFEQTNLPEAISDGMSMGYYLTNDKIVFVFNEYAISPFSEGVISAEAPYSEFADALLITPPEKA